MGARDRPFIIVITLTATATQLSIASGSARAHVDVTLRRIRLDHVWPPPPSTYTCPSQHPLHVFKIIVTPEDIPLGRGKPEVDACATWCLSVVCISGVHFYIRLELPIFVFCWNL